jgi:pyruvate kinase
VNFFGRRRDNKIVTGQKVDKRFAAVMTLGPASWDLPVLESVISSGLMTVARINYSHATDQDEYDNLDNRIRLVHTLAERHGKQVTTFADAPGWKIRILRNFKEPIPVQKGEIITFSTGEDAGCLGCTYPPYLGLGRVGNKVYIGDLGGDNPVLRVTDKRGHLLICQVESGTKIKPGKGLTFENADVPSLELDPITPPDLLALKAGIAAGTKYLGMSYGTRAWQFKAFIAKARELGAAPDVKFVFKYELGSALEDLEEIVKLADVIYFGQGDLSLSISYDQLAIHRQMVIEMCARYGKECWVGTGLLMSLVNGTHPNPGEFAGIIGVRKAGATGLVLSDEFSVGDFPINAARILCRGAEIADT